MSCPVVWFTIVKSDTVYCSNVSLVYCVQFRWSVNITLREVANRTITSSPKISKMYRYDEMIDAVCVGGR